MSYQIKNSMANTKTIQKLGLAKNLELANKSYDSYKLNFERFNKKLKEVTVEFLETQNIAARIDKLQLKYESEAAEKRKILEKEAGIIHQTEED